MLIGSTALNLPLGYINQSTFPLPNLHPVFRDLSKELHLGRGFFVLCGLPVGRYPREDIIIIYDGISSHVDNTRGRQEDTRFSNGASLALSYREHIAYYSRRHYRLSIQYRREVGILH